MYMSNCLCFSACADFSNRIRTVIHNGKRTPTIIPLDAHISGGVLTFVRWVQVWGINLIPLHSLGKD